MVKYYTGFGDKGFTSIGDSRLSKTDSLLCAIGDIDELNTKIGTLIAVISKDIDKYAVVSDSRKYSLNDILMAIQSDLFSIGAYMASLLNKSFAPKRNIGDSDISKIEAYTNAFGNSFPQLKSFVLPGGCPESAAADEARAVARRAERSLVNAANSTKIENVHVLAYMNRLSSLLFVAARFINHVNDVKETPPDY
jgi:cob(I)alamin adenosyltransferase